MACPRSNPFTLPGGGDIVRHLSTRYDTQISLRQVSYTLQTEKVIDKDGVSEASGLCIDQ